MKYDQKTGTVSFSAKLTTGLMSFKGSKSFEPSRDMFNVDGYLRATRLTGVVTYANQNDPNFKPIHNKVVLRTSNEAELMHNSTTYGEWREKWRPVLQFRGPKW